MSDLSNYSSKLSTLLPAPPPRINPWGGKNSLLSSATTSENTTSNDSIDQSKENRSIISSVKKSEKNSTKNPMHSSKTSVKLKIENGNDNSTNSSEAVSKNKQNQKSKWIHMDADIAVASDAKPHNHTKNYNTNSKTSSFTSNDATGTNTTNATGVASNTTNDDIKKSNENKRKLNGKRKKESKPEQTPLASPKIDASDENLETKTMGNLDSTLSLETKTADNVGEDDGKLIGKAVKEIAEAADETTKFGQLKPTNGSTHESGATGTISPESHSSSSSSSQSNLKFSSDGYESYGLTNYQNNYYHGNDHYCHQRRFNDRYYENPNERYSDNDRYFANRPYRSKPYRNDGSSYSSRSNKYTSFNRRQSFNNYNPMNNGPYSPQGQYMNLNSYQQHQQQQQQQHQFLPMMPQGHLPQGYNPYYPNYSNYQYVTQPPQSMSYPLQHDQSSSSIASNESGSADQKSNNVVSSPSASVASIEAIQTPNQGHTLPPLGPLQQYPMVPSPIMPHHIPMRSAPGSPLVPYMAPTSAQSPQVQPRSLDSQDHTQHQQFIDPNMYYGPSPMPPMSPYYIVSPPYMGPPMSPYAMNLKSAMPNNGINPENSPYDKKSRLINQISYYFSQDNLIKDIYLRQHMDSEGWLNMKFLGNFKRVTNITNGDNRMLSNAIKSIGFLEYKNKKVRLANGEWSKWVLPIEQRAVED